MSEHHFIESIWYNRGWLVKIFWPFQLLFLFLVQLKRWLYKSRILSSNRFSKPLIIVGNISIGGTGKTPFIRQLVSLLKKHNVKMGIVSRGYLSQVEHYPHQVSKSDPVEQVGDEAYMQFNHLQIPYVIDPNRSRGVEFLLSNNQVDLVISDDGLQHYTMNRSVEIVLFDAKRQFGNQMILPFGPLREPLSRLNDCDIVVQNGITKTSKNNCAQFKVTVNAINLINLKTNKVQAFDTLSGFSVIAIAGIGNAERFFNTLANVCKIKQQLSFSDHHPFTEDDFNGFESDIIIMTEKDAVKCQLFAKDNWYYLNVTMSFEPLLEQKLEKAILPLVAQKKPSFLL